MSRDLRIPASVDPVLVFGPADGVLRAIIQTVPAVDITVRDSEVTLRGDAAQVSIVAGFIEELIQLARTGKPLSPNAAAHALTLLTRANTANYGTQSSDYQAQLRYSEASTGAGVSSRADSGAHGLGQNPRTGTATLTTTASPSPKTTYSGDSAPRAGRSLGAANPLLRNNPFVDPLIAGAGSGTTVAAQSPGQALYQRAINENTVTFGIGPAGTGKTYLAMAAAVQALLTGRAKRIILTRPAVEAGENLGFLPGSLTDKIDPYLRPLYDALYDLMDPEYVPKLMAANTIEVAPLAYMRGRTLNDAFVVLDEAQNTTAQQMKMFLTRLGFNSKMVVTGDSTQVDLPGGVRSGLRMAEQILDGIPDIAICRLTSADVVRHELVGRIIDAYERYEAVHVADQNTGNRGGNTQGGPGRRTRRQG